MKRERPERLCITACDLTKQLKHEESANEAGTRGASFVGNHKAKPANN